MSLTRKFRKKREISDCVMDSEAQTELRIIPRQMEMYVSVDTFGEASATYQQQTTGNHFYIKESIKVNQSDVLLLSLYDGLSY